MTKKSYARVQKEKGKKDMTKMAEVAIKQFHQAVMDCINRLVLQVVIDEGCKLSEVFVDEINHELVEVHYKDYGYAINIEPGQLDFSIEKKSAIKLEK